MTQTCPVCLAPNLRFALKAQLYAGCERDIFECPDCAAACYWPAPGPEDIARCYPRSYFKGYFRQYWKDYYKGRALAGRLKEWRKEGRLLDVGCALGTLLAGVRDYSSWQVAGLEFSQAAATMGHELNHLDIACAGLAGAPWPDDSFDCIHANNVLEHESDPAAALRGAARLLSRGGRLLLTLPNGPVDLLANRILFSRHGALPTKHGGHLFFFSRRSLICLLERCGFKVLTVRCFHFKMGLKARGWLPGAWRQFLKNRTPDNCKGEEGLTLAEGRACISPRPSWPVYCIRHKFRLLWRHAAFDSGYDLEVVAQKP